jgi:hypothetical protein
MPAGPAGGISRSGSAMRSVPTPAPRDEYAAVKSRLASTYADDRERYTDEKAAFDGAGDVGFAVIRLPGRGPSPFHFAVFLAGLVAGAAAFPVVFAGAFSAGAFSAGTFSAGTFSAGTFFAGAFFAGAFFAAGGAAWASAVRSTIESSPPKLLGR